MNAEGVLTQACIELQSMTIPQYARHTLVQAAHALMNSRPPDQTIVLHARDYLQRWWLDGSTRETGRRYLHRIQSDDDDNPHDHPWDNATLMLEGMIIEQWWPDTQAMHDERRTKWHTPGDVVFRRAEQMHQLKIGQPSITLFATGPKRREWGFWARNEWVPHAKYARESVRRADH